MQRCFKNKTIVELCIESHLELFIFIFLLYIIYYIQLQSIHKILKGHSLELLNLIKFQQSTLKLKIKKKISS